MDDWSPYKPPEISNAVTKPSGPRPPVWPWYVTYCVIFALLYAACVVGCAFALAFAPQLADELEEELLPVQMQFGIMLVVSVPLFILFAVAPLLPKKKWAWIYGFVPICIGLTSCCSLPFSIPLLIFWLKPETKAFFGTD